MDYFLSHRNGFAACEEVRRCSPSPSLFGRREPVLCPKPMRVRASSEAGFCDSTATEEILEILLSEDNYESLLDQQVAVLPVASPPYFCGSPPTRTANPLIHDPGFLQGKHYKQFTHPTPVERIIPVERSNNPLTTTVPFPSSALPMPSAGARSCSSKSFGPKPAAVRVEGFSCSLSRDGRGCSISAFA